jgi:hypothetical protein
MPGIKADGTLSERNRVPKAVREAHGGKGLLPQRGQQTGEVECRLSNFTLEQLDLYEDALPLFFQVARSFKRYLPQDHARQMEEVQKISEDYRHTGLPYTSFTVNLTNRTRGHKDISDLPNGLGGLVTLGEYEGGYTIFPRLRRAFNVRPGDILFADFRNEIHGNGKMAGQRVSVVLYARADLLRCTEK